MKTIKIKFVDYWEKHHIEKDIIYKILCKNYNVVLCEKNPEYIFYSVFGNENLKYNCIKIFYTAENLAPDFNLCDYAIGFEYLNFEDRYIRFPNYLKHFKDFEKMIEKHNAIQKNDADRKFCSFVYSNENGTSERTQIFRELCLYREVDAGGKFLNNIGKQVEDKIDFEMQHKFSVACENSSHLGYTTEKLIQSFAARTVPIYWGDPGVERIFNNKSFINAMSFSSFNELVDYIKLVDNDAQLYYMYLKEPALIDALHYDSKVAELEKFLLNIIEQPYQKAFRRNRFFWGEKYRDKLLQWSLCDNKEIVQKKNIFQGLRDIF